MLKLYKKAYINGGITGVAMPMCFNEEIRNSVNAEANI